MKICKDMEMNISTLVMSQEMPFIANLNEKTSRLEKQNKHIIKLSGGDPNHYPIELFSIIQEIGLNHDKSVLNYSPITGYSRLRELLVSLVSDRYYEQYDGNNILVCSGGCSGLFLTFKTLINYGDKVLIPSPCWEYLPRIVENCGGVSVKIDVMGNMDWDFFLKNIENNIKKGVKIISMNSPLNPTGKIIPIYIQNEIIDLCEKNNIWYVSDDVTIDFNYLKHKSNYIRNSDNFISINSFSKNIGLTGLRLGFILANRKLIDHIKKSQLYTCMYPNSLVQKIMQNYLSNHTNSYYNYVKEISLTYYQKSKLYLKILSQNEYLEIDPIDGGLFLFPRVKDGYYLDYNELLDKYHVVVAPGEAFSPSTKKHFRIFIGTDYDSFIKANEAIEKTIYKI